MPATFITENQQRINKTGCPKMDTLYAFIYFLKLFQHKLEDYRSKPTLIHISSHNINTYRRNPAGNNIHQIMRLNIDQFSRSEE
ncbi:hypothetical protein POY88_00235, partial [Phocaeicola vulgatus]|uniref:hypothetical protein n=1 Tax=Phocaeicola vulgatus TaxID=821 RepID=UPI001E5ADAD9